MLAWFLQFTVTHITFQACFRVLLHSMYRVYILALFVTTRTLESRIKFGLFHKIQHIIVLNGMYTLVYTVSLQ